MITVHICGEMIKGSYDKSFCDSVSFDFDGQNDVQTDINMKQAFFDMKAKGFINVCLVTEDSQVSEDCAMPHLRWGKPYMLGDGGYPTAYVADMDCDEVSACWAA